MKILTSLLLIIVAVMLSGCAATCTISAVVGPTTRMEGVVHDQNGNPVPNCPLEGSWEHSLSWAAWWWAMSYHGHRTLFMSKADGSWSFSRRGVERIFVQIPRDCHQSYFPGYRPGIIRGQSEHIVIMGLTKGQWSG